MIKAFDVSSMDIPLFRFGVGKDTLPVDVARSYAAAYMPNFKVSVESVVKTPTGHRFMAFSKNPARIARIIVDDVR